jgi:hypothetical protein
MLDDPFPALRFYPHAPAVEVHKHEPVHAQQSFREGDGEGDREVRAGESAEEGVRAMMNMEDHVAGWYAGLAVSYDRRSSTQGYPLAILCSWMDLKLHSFLLLGNFRAFTPLASGWSASWPSHLCA